MVQGQLDFAGSLPGGGLTVLNNSYAKVGNLANATVLPLGGVIRVVPTGGDAGTTPALIVNSPQPAESVAGSSGLDLPSLFSTYRDLNTEIAGCAATITLLDQNGLAPWNSTDPIATIPLQPGQNILNLTGDQLASLDVINPAPGGVQPSDATTLVINVAVTGDYVWDVPNVSWQGNEPSRHVLSPCAMSWRGCRRWCGWCRRASAGGNEPAGQRPGVRDGLIAVCRRALRPGP